MAGPLRELYGMGVDEFVALSWAERAALVGHMNARAAAAR